MKGKLLLGAVVVLLIIQLIPVSRENPPVSEQIPAPPEVRKVLARACYDCHSHETRWPWYSAVAPVSWLVANDVEHARKHLNFSTWDQYDARKRRKKLEEAREEVHEGEMPLWYYVLAHPDARLSAEDKELLRAWDRELERGAPR
jgi:hypothetical protein